MQPVFLGFCSVAKRNGCSVTLKGVFILYLAMECVSLDIGF